uniref:Piwi domain-containing protein n=1 Tax=Araucaria cunninghamii TaxID=56994 RepID=A0A0D6R3M2_ARACU
MERGGQRGRGRGGRGRGGEEQRWQQSGQGRGRGFDPAPAASFPPGRGQEFQRGNPPPGAWGRGGAQSNAPPAGVWGRGAPPSNPPSSAGVWGRLGPQNNPPQGWGRGSQQPPQQQPQPQQYTPRPQAPGVASVTARMAEVSVEEPPGSSSSGGSIARISAAASGGVEAKNLKPVKRPDDGGRKGCSQVRLIANHFPVRFLPTQQIFHYDVDITLALQAEGGKRGGKQKGRGGGSKPEDSKSVGVSRADAQEIKNKLIAENRAAFKNAMPVYDGKKNLYSSQPLPVGVYTVKLSKGEDSEVKEYKVALKLANTLDGLRLAEFLKISVTDHMGVQQELLQALDLVVREHPAQSRIIMGRSLYAPMPDRDGLIGGGAVAARGFSMSLRPTKQGLSLNLDFSVVAFHQSMPVLEYLWENRGVDCQENKPLNPKERRDAEQCLRGLKVTVTHRRTKQKFMVMRLTKPTTRELNFDIGENGQPKQSVSLVDYYRQRYNVDIRFKQLPCLDLSKQADRPNYVPMEFCNICEGQRFPKDNLSGDQTKGMLRMACPRVRDRLRIINEIMARSDGPARGPFLPHFRMSVGTEMTQVTARVLEAPEMRLGDRGQVQKVTPRPDDRQWNLLRSHVFDGKQIERWGIIYFARDNPHKLKFQIDNFCNAMVYRFRSLGINMAEGPMVCEPDTMSKFENFPQLQRSLAAINDRCRKQLQILICVMDGRHNGYKNLKLICETEIGLVTQCCLFEHVRRCNDSKYGSQYLANLALKINAKVGGSNAALAQGLSIQLPRFGNSHVVYFGADVNHPGKRDERSPSIAAVVMSINWPYSNRYVVKIRCQKNRQEYISELGDMAKELLDEYLKVNKRLPERIIFFRDGVSEGQFDIVLNRELMALKAAFMSFGSGSYDPCVSFIVAQKRHHTRLFPLGDVGTKSGNVPPGTVVDTVIVHPREFDFYLCSHYGLLGTSKPTHYHVLWDENGFGSDELQTLINNLCYTFARCTKPVSLVPPVYYADLAAYRGRMYVEGLTYNSDASSSASSSSTSSTSITIPKINVGVENFMFFL